MNNLKEAIRDLVPIIGIFIIVFYLGAYVGDYQFHLDNYGNNTYPQFVSYVLNIFSVIIPRNIAILLLMLFTVVIIPYILLWNITGNRLPAFVYIYGSQIPLMLGFIWFLPQAVIHIFMLLMYKYTWFAIIFLLIGWTVHDKWYLAFLFVIFYKIYRWYFDRQTYKLK